MKSSSSSFSTSSVTTLLRPDANILRLCWVCILGWRWDDAVWSSYQFWAYPRVPRQKHLGLPLKRKSSFLSLELGVLILSSTPLLNLLGWSQLLVVFLTVWGWALTRWSPTCNSPQMLRQLGSILLPELGLLWFLLLYGLLEILPSSNMLTLLLLAC